LRHEANKLIAALPSQKRVEAMDYLIGALGNRVKPADWELILKHFGEKCKELRG
jgi:hypothetical protein